MDINTRIVNSFFITGYPPASILAIISNILDAMTGVLAVSGGRVLVIFRLRRAAFAACGGSGNFV